MKSFFVVMSLFIFVPAYGASYQDGDLIFHESQSPQSKAIQEATASKWGHVGILFSNGGKWYVGEAVQPVKVTPLADFIKRGKNRVYEIHRLIGMTEVQRQALRAEVDSYMGRNYDIYFEWSDELIYCSELVYKAFMKAVGVEIGVVQKFRDMKMDGPYVKELIRRRTTDGHTVDLEEPIVTPASQIADPKLELVEKSN